MAYAQCVSTGKDHSVPDQFRMNGHQISRNTQVPDHLSSKV